MLGSCFLLPSSASFLLTLLIQAAAPSAPLSLTAYTTAFRNSPAYKDLWAVRNVRPAFNTRLGVFGGVMYAGVDTMLRGRVPWTLRHHAHGGMG